MIENILLLFIIILFVIEIITVTLRPTKNQNEDHFIDDNNNNIINNNNNNNNINYIFRNTFITTLLKNKLINDRKKYNSDFFNMSIFKSNFEINNFMLLIQPQNYHFFIENKKLIYHPNNKHLDGLLKQYSCESGFELAYNLPLNIISNNNNNNNNDEDDDDDEEEEAEDEDDKINSNNNNYFPSIICHKNLNYLKMNIYKPGNIIFYKKFYELQNPINAIKVTINDFITYLN